MTLPRRSFLFSTGALAGAGLLTPRAAAQESGQVRETLPNGLVVIVEERRSAATIAVRLTSRGGARDETERPGLPLLTIRTMLTGTPNRPAATAITRAAALAGGSITAGAGDESSSGFSLMPSTEAALAFDLVSDLALRPLMSEAGFTSRKQLILQEIAQRAATPANLLADRFQQELYRGHPVSTIVAGTEAAVETLTLQDVLAWHDRYVVASNSVLVVVGRVRPAEALDLARRYFGDMRAGTVNQRPLTPLLAPAAPRVVHLPAGQQQTQFRLGFLATSYLDTDRPAIIVMNAILGGFSGRLSNQIRSNLGIAYSAGSSTQTYADTGSWYVTAGVDPQNLDAAAAAATTEITRLREETPPADEVASRIELVAGGQIMADEPNAGRADRLAARAINGTPDTPEFVRLVRAVTPQDVQRVARTYLDVGRSLLVIAGPMPPSASN